MVPCIDWLESDVSLRHVPQRWEERKGELDLGGFSF